MPKRSSLVSTALLAVAVAVAACASAPPAPTASQPSGREEPWQAAEVVQPSDVTSAPSLEAGYQCHPCHFLAENQLLGVGEAPAGPIAVGVQQPPAQAVAFASIDGARWVPVPGFAAASGSAALAAASNRSVSVIVGSDADGATAWASGSEGWRQAPRQPDLRVPYAAGAMTTVSAFGPGFVAGGYRDDPLRATAAAEVWRSDHGLTWRADRSSAFAGGRIWGIASASGTIVAVGTNGDPNYGPAGAWRWTTETGWQRAQIEPAAGGAMRAVTATAFGFVAVGLNGHDDGALAWRSRDGLVWTASPDQPGFHYFSSPVRMQSVLSVPAGLVAGGWRSDPGKGSAVTWTSSDGVTWVGPTWESAFSGGQITGLARGAGWIVAVGRDGYPDWNQAAVWRQPLG